MKVEPVVSWDNRLHVTVKISSKEQGAGQSSTLNFRTPFWAHSDAAKAVLNGQELSLPIPGNFLSITRKWSTNDMITLELPISIRTEAIQDDRPEYSSDHAMLYGPYLLVGLTVGDRNINAKAAGSLSDWITPIPASYNSHLITLSQESGNKTFVLANSNKSIKVGTLPEPGSNHSVYATFRLILKDSNSSKLSAAEDFIGKSVLLEPFDIPGMVVVQQGIDQSLGVADSSGSSNSVFLLVAGLDGKKKSVSLESERHRGCYMYSVRNLHVSVKLKCSSGSSDVGFKQAASFTLRDGISKYDPISFVVKGATRNFLLQPLVSLRDENYVVYFNIQSENVQMENLKSS